MWYDTALSVCPGCGMIYVSKKREIKQVGGSLKLLSESDVSQEKKKRFTTREGYELRQLIIEAQRMGLPKSHAFRVFYNRKKARECHLSD
jgi:hypothetical protein